MQQASMRIALVALPLCLAACQHAAPAVRTPAQPKPLTVASSRSDRYIALGELRARDRIIVFLSGANGPAYTVKSEDGTILATRLTEAEILAMFPELTNAVAEGILADSHHFSDPDASVDVPRPQGYIESRTVEPLSLTPQR